MTSVCLAWKAFLSSVTVVRKVAGGCPSKATATDDNYVVSESKEDFYQTAGKIVRLLFEAQFVAYSI